MSDEPKPDPAEIDAESKSAAGWLAQNREALESSNAYGEKYGLPLARYRLF